MGKLYDVIIAGGWPVGLFLATELRLARASVLVLEHDATPDNPWKSFPLGFRGLNMLSVEILYRRGLLHHFNNPGSDKPAGFDFSRSAGHFAGLPLIAGDLKGSSWKYRIAAPGVNPGRTTTEQIESILSKHAESVGVDIVRGNGITSLAQDNSSVRVETTQSQTFRGRYLVGCDGGRSTVRKLAAIDFVGTQPKYTAFSATCTLDPPNMLKPGFHKTDNGFMVVVPGPITCVHLLDFSAANFDRTQEITLEHFQEAFTRISGRTDIQVTALHQVTSSTDRCKKAATYRRGRVILAGDAAHIHSPIGAQGLNLGLCDAMNLGWKLGALVRAEAHGTSNQMHTGLLDSYEKERSPVADWVLEWTRAQVSTLMPDLYGKAIRKVVEDLIATTEGMSQMIAKVWGVDIRYDLSNGQEVHDLVGRSAPDFDFEDGTRLGEKMREGRWLIVVFNGMETLAEQVKRKAEIRYIAGRAKDEKGLEALLIRPDGIVAWAVESDLSSKEILQGLSAHPVC
ncbi:putative pentachlorophenol 4-monooxygenase [Elsinoe ampelina]|uniref:Putative pentachlorophenol 4-monooxygenase n=1 Tax=Elsinoe ampelina TaxID=302913 RepID=A0A6A6G6S0_9PEZI|nr:putative pentachlorophenol 4-monooxygenase [Elsinoe ampelina]